MITIGFASHHVETLPFVREQMERHQVIVLEEPPSPHFPAMLSGAISISDYIMELDSGFPEFEHRMCTLLRELHRKGGRILQVEPYLEKLLQIHELFADGKTVDQVMQVEELKEVYSAEKHATGALIAYYARSMDEPFELVVEAVKNFARADAYRLILRERLRAKAIALLYEPAENMYVEAGYIHYPLYRYLRHELGKQERIRVAFLLAPVVKKLHAKRRNMGPGDILTLHYAFHDGLQEDLANLLAARSLIYIKLIRKEELIPGNSEAPHAEDEVKVNRLVDRLNFNHCKELFEQIRLAKQEGAVELAEKYVGKLAGGKN
ncbi:MAG: hypothetical protein PVF76_16805 [Syntrophobacterales bacterium]|jgi:hypothetical protein